MGSSWWTCTVKLYVYNKKYFYEYNKKTVCNLLNCASVISTCSDTLVNYRLPPADVCFQMPYVEFVVYHFDQTQ